MSTSTAPPVPGASPPAPGGHRGIPVVVLVAVTAVVALLLGVGGTLLLGPGSDDTTAGPSSSPSASAAPPASAAPSATATPSAGPTATAFRFQPLWPFAGPADAVTWQRAAGGSQPWRLDAGLTAVTFTRTFLGFDGLGTVTSTQAVGDEAWVGVGPGAPGNGTAAVLHLARIGAGEHRPWEVVGSRDTTLTLTTPAYGAVATSPLPVGGRVTGVDESLRVQVRALDGTVLGTGPALPAGGNVTPWSIPVPLDLTRPGVATIVVSTGGHLAEVERFALTAVRVAGPSS